MKHFLFVSLLAFALILPGCNDDVFIDRLEASRTEFHFGMLGGDAEVSLSHGDWLIGSITVDGLGVPGMLYREDDKVGSHVGTVYLKGLGKVVCEGTLSFTVSRPDERSLHIEFGQSLETEGKLIEINLESDYEHLALRVTQDACCGYELDRIEYGDILFHSSEGAMTEGWKMTVNNESDETLTQEWPVFNDEAMKRKVHFPVEWIDDKQMPGAGKHDVLMKLVGGPFEVPLPDPELKGGELQFSGGTVSFGYEPAYLPHELVNENFAAIFPPGQRTVSVYWGYDEYDVDCTLFFKHPEGGKPLQLSGVFRSFTYNGEWFRFYEE